MSRRAVYRLIIVVLFVVFLLTMIQFAYQSIMNSEWKARNQALHWAYELTDLRQSEQVEFFAFAESYIVVSGKDEEGRDMIVWVGDEIIHQEYTDNGIGRNNIRIAVNEANPNNQIIRITPGKYKNDWAWEVHYEREEAGGVRQYYDFYRFTDGELLNTLTMVMK